MKWQWKPGWLEIAFVFLLLSNIGISLVPGTSGAGAVVTVACYVAGLLVLVRFVRKNLKTALWRLRNRLIVSYMFIAVVPITLLMLLVVNAGRVLMGQVAVYLVTTELERRMAGVSAAPSPEVLSSLGSSLGDVLLVEWKSGSNPDPSFKGLRQHHLPPPVNLLDGELTGVSRIALHSAICSCRSFPSFRRVANSLRPRKRLGRGRHDIFRCGRVSFPDRSTGVDYRGSLHHPDRHRRGSRSLRGH